MLLSAAPSPFEQEMLWLINDMRTDPADHLDHFITGYGTPATSSDEKIRDAMAYFKVVGATLQSDWSTLTATAPVAWSSLLDDAAEFHSRKMIDEDAQEHEFPPGPDLADRITATGYTWAGAGENIFAYSESALHGHAGFVVDWGNGIDGMQNPPGHRDNIMTPLWMHVGIAAIAENDSETDVGPYVVTQDFGKPRPDGDAYLVGTIWADVNADGKFDGGEGFGGVTVTAVGAATYSTTSWGAGGYQLQLPAGTYDVSIPSGAFAGTHLGQVTVADENVKLDANPQGRGVVGRHLFYNNSVWDGKDLTANQADDAAITWDKSPLLPGGTAGPANYTSHSRGISGLMVDIYDPIDVPVLADFEFKAGADPDPNNWSAVPAPALTVRPGEGGGGSDRVTLIWGDDEIRNQWVEVKVLSDAGGGGLGLIEDDVFYFGNSVGDCDGDGEVGSSDYGTFAGEFGLHGGIGALAADLNGDGRVDLTDFAIVRGAIGNSVLAPTIPAGPVGQTIRFAVIGDYGSGSTDEADVAGLVTSWDPDFVVTTGDNRYGLTTFDEVVGQYYSSFLTDAGSGPYCSGGDSPINAFFPSTGNHDYWDGGGIDEYLDYFTLPGAGVDSTGTSGSELYYDFVQGPVHFFVLDSETALFDPDDMTAQQDWLQAQLAVSTTPWQAVYMHHPPYSSGMHGSESGMQWPYATWGADFVMSGHDHDYERIEADGIVYFVNGLGGSSSYPFMTPVDGSQVRYTDDFGAMLVDASAGAVRFRFINRSGLVVDDYTYNGQSVDLVIANGTVAENGPAAPLTAALQAVDELIAAAAAPIVPVVSQPLDDLLAELPSAAGDISGHQPISGGPSAMKLYRAAMGEYDLQPLRDDLATGGQADDLLADILAESPPAVPL